MGNTHFSFCHSFLVLSLISRFVTHFSFLIESIYECPGFYENIGLLCKINIFSLFLSSCQFQDVYCIRLYSVMLIRM
jgi:hypothetical protein